MDAALLPAPRRPVLWGRASVLGAVGLASGAVSHVAGGGRLPHPVLMTVLLVGSVLAAARLLRVRATTGRLVLAVVVAQTVFHGLLSALAGHRGDPVQTTAAPPPLPVAEGPRTGSLIDLYHRAYADVPPTGGGSGDWLGHQVDHLTEQGPAMVLAHVAGAVLLGLFLAVGESALWSLVALLAARAHVLRARWGLVLAAAHVRSGTALARPRVRRVRRVPHRSQVHAVRTVRRRGPPFVLAA